MRSVLLATIVVFAFAQPAASDISAGPPGLINVVDSNGKIVGGLIDFSPEDNPSWVVSLDTSEGAGFVTFFENSDHINMDDVYWTSPDCTGQAYARSHVVSAGLDGGFGLMVGGNQHVYAATGVGETGVYIASMMPAGIAQNCQVPPWTPSTLVPVTNAGDFSAEFTGPFSLQTVMGVKQATVPPTDPSPLSRTPVSLFSLYRTWRRM